MKVRDVIEQAYIAGYRHALHTWAFWKDGRQYVGNSTHMPLDEAEQHAAEILEYPIERFIEKMTERWAPAGVMGGPLPPAVGGTSDGAS